MLIKFLYYKYLVSLIKTSKQVKNNIYLFSSLGAKMTKKLKVWFNHSFSTTYHFIDLIRKNFEKREFEIFGTHATSNAIYLSLCEHNEIEPPLKDREYLDFCLDFCLKNKIDVLIPGYKRLFLIGENLEEFTKIGVKVLISSDKRFLEEVKDKSKTYKIFEKNNLIEIPQSYVVNTAEEFKEAYEKIIANDSKVCFKPTIAEGGIGFRIIDQKADSYAYMTGVMHARVTFEQAYKALSEEDTFPDIMVSEYLDGEEYSIDCLAYQGKLHLAVPRKKMNNRLRILENNLELIELAKKFNDYYKPDYIFNIQVRYKNNIPKLLEINPRMSGGMQHSCLVGGNMPYLALKLLLGEEITIPELNFNIISSEVETTVILKNFI